MAVGTCTVEWGGVELRSVLALELSASEEVSGNEVNEIREIALEHIIQKDGVVWYVGTGTE